MCGPGRALRPPPEPEAWLSSRSVPGVVQSAVRGGGVHARLCGLTFPEIKHFRVAFEPGIPNCVTLSNGK